MKVLITGGEGFIGPYLAGLLASKGNNVLSTYYNQINNINEINPKVTKMECDIRDKEKVFLIIKDFKPDKIFHLAAQSYPRKSWENPWYTIETNILGTINIFEGVKTFKKDCKILNACSSAQYGFVDKKNIPVKENHAMKPLHPYGVSKLAQENLAYQYFKNFGIQSVTIRIFNTTGPGKIGDVYSDFTKRIIEMEKGINPEKIMNVGNIDSKRTITDVRDLIRAFDIALDKATIGEVYNISGEKVYKISEIIDILKSLVNFEFELEIDPKLLRTTDEPIIYGDSSKFKNETGWEREIPIEKTLMDMLDYWRKML